MKIIEEERRLKTFEITYNDSKLETVQAAFRNAVDRYVKQEYINGENWMDEKGRRRLVKNFKIRRI